MDIDGRRLDCGPYMSGALEAKVILERLPQAKEPLNELCLGGRDGIINPGRIKRLWVVDDTHGVRFLSSTDILQSDLSSLQLIGRSAVRANPKLLISAGSTLITRAGTVGRMAFVRPDMHGLACTEDVLRVVPDADRVPPGYLHAYLRSKFGVPLIVSGTYGAIIQHIEPHHIADLPVPRLGKSVESRADELVIKSANLLAKYQADVNSATKRLFESVGLEDITAADWHLMGRDLGFRVAAPSVDSLRALNFTPRFQKLVEAVKAAPHKDLGDLVVPGTLQRGARFKRIDAAPEYSFQLVGQRELFWVKPEGRWIAKSSAGRDVIVAPGTILVAAQGTLGESELYCRAEFIWGPAAQLAYSEHLLRVVANEQEMPAGCLYAFMRSETAFRMFRSISTGTKLQDHHHVMRAQLPVPYPSKSVRDEVHRMVVDAYDARHEAVALEDQAIALVEDAIEKGAN
ncbi:methylation-associated defense system restriction endonuclease subunit S MAD5 [Microvirga sp. P5_D2]